MPGIVFSSRIYPACNFLLFTTFKLLTLAAIAKYKPQDTTTNPFLILEASRNPQYAHLVDAAVDYGRSQVRRPRFCLIATDLLQGTTLNDKVDAALDRLLVEFGREILKIIPGKVSTEVDARFSFDTKATVEKALHIVNACTSRSPSPTWPTLTMLRSCTKSLESLKTASSSRLLQPGRASKPPKSSRESTVSIVT